MAPALLKFEGAHMALMNNDMGHKIMHSCPVHALWLCLWTWWGKCRPTQVCSSTLSFCSKMFWFCFFSYCSSGRVPTAAALILQWRGLTKESSESAAQTHYLSLSNSSQTSATLHTLHCRTIWACNALVLVLLVLAGYNLILNNQTRLISSYEHVTIPL